MHNQQLIECVPNFSEGQNPIVIQAIRQAIEQVPKVKLLHVDPGMAANRTVMTFVGPPEAAVEAAFAAIKTAAQHIDMSRQQGEHPRIGATDVCPLIPIANISMEEVVQLAHQLAERVGRELEIPVYLYEAAASNASRKNLATIRSGEYEGLEEKMQHPDWQPDYGPAIFKPKAGASVIGARDFLVAYNVNLETSSVKLANAIAFDVRERGRAKRLEDGSIIRNKAGKAERIPGTCKFVKAIGWFIEEYGFAQVSMNLTNINVTPMHIAFEACRKSAERRGTRVRGSELIGLVPLQVLLEAGTYFLEKQGKNHGQAGSRKD